MTERAEMEAALEAVLFVAPEPLPRERLLELFEEPERALAAEALDAVLERYKSGDGRGVMMEEVAGGIRLATRPELHPYLKRFFQVTGRSRLSMPALETLAIIAYRQPLTLPEVTEVRGAQSATVIKTLLERRMIRISGRKQVVGKPFLYSTTREFLLHFGLGSLADLPPLEEMEELFAMEGAGEIVPDREEDLARESAALEAAADERAEERELHEDLRAEATAESLEVESVESVDAADSALDDEDAHDAAGLDAAADEASAAEGEPVTVYHGDDEG